METAFTAGTGGEMSLHRAEIDKLVMSVPQSRMSCDPMRHFPVLSEEVGTRWPDVLPVDDERGSIPIVLENIIPFLPKGKEREYRPFEKSMSIRDTSNRQLAVLNAGPRRRDLPAFRLQIEGTACQLRLLVPLLRHFALAFASTPDDVLVHEVHVAFDFAVPIASMMVFQHRRADENVQTVASSAHVLINPFDGSNTTNVTLGSRDGLQVCVYDKVMQLLTAKPARGRMPLPPAYARNARSISRVEFRLRLPPGQRPPLRDALAPLASAISTWGVVDLRRARESRLRNLLQYARSAGMTLAAPSVLLARNRQTLEEKRKRRSEEPRNPARRYRATSYVSFPQQLVLDLLSGGSREDTAKRDAVLLLEAVEAELVRVEQDGLRLPDLAKEWLPRLQREVDSALGPGMTEGSTEGAAA